MLKIVTCLALVAALAQPAAGQSVTTQFTGVPAKHGNMFEIRPHQQFTVDRFDVHFDDTNNPAPCGNSCSVNEVEVYWRWGGYKGAENNPSAWQLRGSVQHTISTGVGVPQPLSLAFDRTLLPGPAAVAGFYITATGDTNSVTGLPNERARSTFFFKSISSAVMNLSTGTDNVYPFGTATNNGAWDGTVYYTLCSGGEVETYCQAGTSASGCQAALEATGVPSASAGGGFVLSADNVEGNKNGLFYFGTAGKSSQPWGSTSSFKCVNFPTRRGALISSGGTAGACDGSFSYDLNAHWAAKPSHNPGGGATVQAQLWYRDPSSSGNPKTAFSNAVQFIVCL
jgi:hypothetical protein